MSIVKVSRRRFLKGTTAVITSLTLGVSLPPRSFAGSSEFSPALFQPNIWLAVGADDNVTVWIAESEMGQGVMTSLPMLVAEELEVDWRAIRVQHAPSTPEYGKQYTGGSTSIRSAWLPMRQAGAVARTMLISAAARQWGVPPEACRAEHGAVVHPPTDRRMRYGELVATAAKMTVPNAVRLKEPDDFRVIGTVQPRLDIPAKVDGSAVFGMDVRLPGMLTATVVHCPEFGGRIAQLNDVRARQVRGVRDIIPLHDRVAIVASETWSALQGAQALQVGWESRNHGTLSTPSIRERLHHAVQQRGTVVRDEGDVERVLGAAESTVSAEYDLPFQAHAPMEPMCCTVRIQDGHCEIWAPTQSPTGAQRAAAPYMRSGLDALLGKLRRRLGAEPDIAAVTVHTTYLGGGFGRRLQQDYVAEAVEIAQAVGAPVRLVWSREEDIQHDYYHPVTYHRLHGVLDARGMPLAWRHRFAGPSVSGAGAEDLPYAIPNVQVEYSRVDTGVPTGPWRSVGHAYNAFATECFLDELAFAGHQDPLELRLRLLDEHSRLRQTLVRVADLARWGRQLPDHHHHGVAAHTSFGSHVAQVVELSVQPTVGIVVHKVTCVVDCGFAVNPDTVRAQMESAIVFGLSATLKGKITIRDGRVEQSNFSDFPILTMPEMPTVDVHIIPSRQSPGGIGEPGVPPIAPAVANAVRAATGQPILGLPLVGTSGTSR